ncbi:MAG TPA: nucleoside kinase, partial [Spirochaetia bacterium]|nr:nucleoside kinase [Spirochaetia bacterium]
MKEIRVTYPDGRVLSYPFLIKASDALEPLGTLPRPLAAALINNELCPLDYFLTTDCTLAPVTVDTNLGAVTYRRSLCFLLAMASRELFPNRRLVAGMAIGTGFFHFFDDDEKDDPKDIRILEKRMRELVARDIPIHREWMSYSGALEYFRTQGQTDTLALLEHMNDPRIAVNECAGFRDLHVTPLVPSTGVLAVFELLPYHDGFLLRYPHKEDDKVPPFEDDPVLYRIATEYRERGKILGVSSVGTLNSINSPKKIKEYIQVAEALQNKKMAELADQVAARAGTVK